MLDRLRGGQQASAQSWRALIFFDDLGALFRDADDGCASFALRLLLDDGKHLLQALDRAFGFGAVIFERGLEILALRSLCHLRQSGKDFLLREVDVLQGIVKQIVKCLRLFGQTGPSSAGLPASCQSLVRIFSSSGCAIGARPLLMTHRNSNSLQRVPICRAKNGRAPARRARLCLRAVSAKGGDPCRSKRGVAPAPPSRLRKPREDRGPVTASPCSSPQG
jgi:hypothetical protein